MKKNYNVILFDGVCHLCHGAIRFILKRDFNDRFRFAPIKSSIGQTYLKAHQLDNLNPDSIILLENDQYYERSTALFRILKELRGFWGTFFFLIHIPRPIRDFFYDLVARHRYRIFGRYESCPIPHPEWKNRFLD